MVWIMDHLNQQNGSAFIIVLMALVIMSLLGTAFLIMSGIEPESSFIESVGVRAFYQTETILDDYVYEFLHGVDSDNPPDGYPDTYEQVMINGGRIDTTYTLIDSSGSAENFDVELSIYRIPTKYTPASNPIDDKSPYVSLVEMGEDNIWGQPVVLDLDDDGEMDVLVATDQGNIYRYIYQLAEYQNNYGKTMVRYQLEPHPSQPVFASAIGEIYGGIVVEDLDNDGTVELLVVGGNTLYCFAPDGSQNWTYAGSGSVDYNLNGYYAEPTTGEIDSDEWGYDPVNREWVPLDEPNREVAFIALTATAAELVILEDDGTVIDQVQIPKFTDDSGVSYIGYAHSRPVFADVNGGSRVGADHANEIIASNGYFIFCFDEYDNTWQERWRYPVGMENKNASGDFTDDDHFLPKTAFYNPQPSVADVDIDASNELDGDKEVIFGSTDGYLVVLDDQGRNDMTITINDVRIPVNTTTQDPCMTLPIEVFNIDMDTDSIPEIIVEANGEIKAFHISYDAAFAGGTAGDALDWEPWETSTAVDNINLITGVGAYVEVYSMTEPVGESITGPINFRNLDNDPELEMVYGTLFNTASHLVVLDFDYTSGTMLGTYLRIAFEEESAPSFYGGVALHDLDGDGYVEMIAGSGALSSDVPTKLDSQYLLAYTLKNMDLPRCIIEAEVTGQKSRAVRRIEAVIRMQIEPEEDHCNYEIMAWTER